MSTAQTLQTLVRDTRVAIIASYNLQNANAEDSRKLSLLPPLYPELPNHVYWQADDQDISDDVEDANGQPVLVYVAADTVHSGIPERL